MRTKTNSKRNIKKCWDYIISFVWPCELIQSRICCEKRSICCQKLNKIQQKNNVKKLFICWLHHHHPQLKAQTQTTVSSIVLRLSLVEPWLASTYREKPKRQQKWKQKPTQWTTPAPAPTSRPWTWTRNDVNFSLYKKVVCEEPCLFVWRTWFFFFCFLFKVNTMNGWLEKERRSKVEYNFSSSSFIFFFLCFISMSRHLTSSKWRWWLLIFLFNWLPPHEELHYFDVDWSLAGWSKSRLVESNCWDQNRSICCALLISFESCEWSDLWWWIV